MLDDNEIIWPVTFSNEKHCKVILGKQFGAMVKRRVAESDYCGIKKGEQISAEVILLVEDDECWSKYNHYKGFDAAHLKDFCNVLKELDDWCEENLDKKKYGCYYFK